MKEKLDFLAKIIVLSLAWNIFSILWSLIFGHTSKHYLLSNVGIDALFSFFICFYFVYKSNQYNKINKL